MGRAHWSEPPVRQEEVGRLQGARGFISPPLDAAVEPGDMFDHFEPFTKIPGCVAGAR